MILNKLKNPALLYQMRSDVHDEGCAIWYRR